MQEALSPDSERRESMTNDASTELKPGSANPSVQAWTFLSNHAHVILLLARDPEIRLRDVAEKVGITERAVQRIVADLEADHYIKRERHGRRNHYSVNPTLRLRHPVEAHQTVGALLSLILGNAEQPGNGKT